MKDLPEKTESEEKEEADSAAQLPEEVAERLGVSVNTIKSLKKSAYVTLRTLLSKDLLMILFVLVDK